MLPGRSDDAAWLHDVVTGADRGAVALLCAEAGAGKTRLLQEVLGPHDPIWVTFPRALHPAPGHGLRALLAELGGVGHRPGPGRRSVARAVLERAATYRAVSAGLAGQSRIVVFDDAQWADELTLGWLAQAAEVVAGTGTRLVAAVRTAGPLPPAVAEAVLPLRRADLVTTRTLGPLPLDAVRDLAAGLGLALDERRCAELLAVTDGLALAVQEMLHRLAAGDGPAAMPAAGAGDSVLARIVGEDVDDLPADARGLVHAAAVGPQPVSEPLLRGVLGFGPERFDAAVAAAEVTGLLRRIGPGQLAFRHELHRECVYGTLPLAARRQLHRTVAHALAAQADAPARLVAAQLLDAGAVLDALPYLERAAEAAIGAHDLGNAFAHLRTAVTACPAERAAQRTLLAERAVVVAIAADLAPAALDLLDTLLGADRDADQRGRLLLCRARVATYAGDFAARVTDLTAARGAFTLARDDVGVALSMGELSLPVAGVLPLADHVRVGREALALAERTGDPRAIVLCAGNLAAAELLTGNAGAFALWQRAAAVIAERDPSNLDTAERVRHNWLASLLMYGRYDEARRLLVDLRARPGGDPDHGLTEAYDAVVHWRLGRWTDADAAARRAGESQATPRHLSAALLAMISFERDRRPDMTPLRDAAQFFFADHDEIWAPVTLAWLIHVRRARREPQPERGLAELVRRIVATSTVVGWEDVLPAAAQVGPAAGRTLLALPAELLPRGPRAEPAIRFAEGLVAGHTGQDAAADLLLAAADGYAALGEPYHAAQSLAAAADVRAGQGRRAGDLWARAAGTFRDLGADRSLASLLRRAGSTRALDGFRVPTGQRFAGAVGLTERERAVADLARWGRTAREIAGELGIAESTVRTHLDRVKTKLGARRARDLIRLLAEPSA